MIMDNLAGSEENFPKLIDPGASFGAFIGKLGDVLIKDSPLFTMHDGMVLLCGDCYLRGVEREEKLPFSILNATAQITTYRYTYLSFVVKSGH